MASETIDAKANLYQRLLSVQRAVTYFQQNQQGDRFMYVASGDVLTTIREAMDVAGVILSVSVLDAQVELNCVYKNAQHFTQITVGLEWINADNPEERLSWQMYGQGIDSGEKGVGKALTYAEKYGLLKFFHVATGKHDDPDSYQDEPESYEGGNGNGNGGSKPAPAPRPTAPPVEKQPPAAPAAPGEFSNVGQLFTALQTIGVGTDERNKLRAQLGIKAEWQNMTPEQWGEIYEAAKAAGATA